MGRGRNSVTSTGHTVPKGDPVLPRMEHVLAIKPHREPWVFVGNPRPAASKGKKAVRIPRLKEGPQSLRKMSWRAG